MYANVMRMPLCSLERACKMKKGLEAITGEEYQIIEYWGKSGLYYVRKKPKRRKVTT